MKLLTDSEREARDYAWANFYTDPHDSDFDSFATGFNAALDHSAAELAALTAEVDKLKLHIKARDVLLSKMGIDPAKIKVDDNE